MASVDNLVHETTQTTGTGNLTLTNKSGKQSFNDAFSTGGTDVFYYFISHQSASEWEVGTGHMDDASTLVRDTVIASSNSDALVDFSAGTKDVTNAVPSAQSFVRENELIGVPFHFVDTSDDSITLVESAFEAFDIKTVIAITSAGSVSATVKINGVAVTGMSAQTVNTTQTTLTATGANSVAVGARVTIEWTNSSGADFAGILKGQLT